MLRGGTGPEGSEYVAQNGYKYRKVNGHWKDIRHIVAEEVLGRPMEKGERVICLVKEARLNPTPETIRIDTVKARTEVQSIRRQERRLWVLKVELQDMLDKVDEALQKIESLQE